MKIVDELRQCLRSISRDAGFATIVIMEIAVGLGIAAIILTLAKALVFNELPFDKDRRVFYVTSQDPQRNNPLGPTSYPDLLDLRAQATTFASLHAFTGGPVAVGDDAHQTEIQPAAQMTAESFRSIGQHPLLGRDFEPGDESPSAPPVAILTYGFWKHRYGEDPTIVNRTIRINQMPTTVIGVMPPDFVFPVNVELWTPLVQSPNSKRRQARNLNLFGVLAPGATLADARAQVAAIGKSLQQSFPDTNEGIELVVRTYRDVYVGPQIATMAQVMLFSAGIVLLIVVANILNLQLLRALRLTRDMVVRRALGASRPSIARRFLLEGYILAGTGGVLAYLMARAGAVLLDRAYTPFGKPAWVVFAVDPTIVAYLIAGVVVLALVLGLVPAAQLWRADIGLALKQHDPRTGFGVLSGKVVGPLLVGELALATVLLTGAALLVNTFLNLSNARIGVDPANVVTMRVQLPPGKFRQPADQQALYQRLERTLAAEPRIEAVALTSHLPTGGSQSFQYELDEGLSESEAKRPTISAVVTSSRYPDVWGLLPVAGRTFSDADTATALPVALINEAAADLLWRKRSPLGHKIRLSTSSQQDAWRTVVGVVPNILQNDRVPRQSDPVVYLPLGQRPVQTVAVIVRSVSGDAALSEALHRAVRETDAELAVANVSSMEQRLEQNYWLQRIRAFMFTVFATVALFLAAAGLFTLMAASVASRLREISIRVSLGASPATVVWHVGWMAALVTAVGLLIGLAGSIAFGRVIESALVQVSTLDPMSYTIAALVLCGSAVLGCMVPLLRAASLDPAVILREP